MGRLFWKFFAIFWLAQVVTSLGVGGAIWLIRHERANEGPPPPGFYPPGRPGFPDGGGRPPPPDARFGGSPDRMAGPPPASGARPGGHPRHPLWQVPVLPLLAGAIVSLLFAALLAWWFSRRIKTLKSAFDAVADGRLDTRIGPQFRGSDELAALGRDFDHMAEHLQGVIESQRRLLHDVSHEVRSPLARLQAAIELMRQQPDRAEEFMARIERDSGRIDRLVGDILTLSRLDGAADGSVREAVLVAELLEAVADDARFEAANGPSPAPEILVEASPDLVVQADPAQLQRACENLVRNALRHGRPSAAETLPHIRLRAQAKGSHVVIEIEDNGPGVRPSELPRLAEPFFRASGNGAPGYGLGMAIAKRIVVAHGGTMTAANGTNVGLVVRMSIPCGVS